MAKLTRFTGKLFSKCVCFHSLCSVQLLYRFWGGCGDQQIMCSKKSLIFCCICKPENQHHVGCHSVCVRVPAGARGLVTVCAAFTTPHFCAFLLEADFLHKTSAMFESLSCYRPVKLRINVALNVLLGEREEKNILVGQVSPEVLLQCRNVYSPGFSQVSFVTLLFPNF